MELTPLDTELFRLHQTLRKPHKPKRLPERKAVTIGIGFHCRDGVVLAADQQQTVPGGYKVHSRKLGNIIYGGATILWAYSYLDNLATVMKDGLLSKLSPSSSPTPGQIYNAISEQITEMEKRYPEEMQYQQFLYAYSCGASTRFVRVSGGIVDEPPEFACIGAGDSSLIRYIHKTFSFGPSMLMHIGDGLRLAVYMVHLAKQFVDGVGGPTDAVILRNGSVIPLFITGQQIERIEKDCDRMQDMFGDLYRNLPPAPEPGSASQLEVEPPTPLPPSVSRKSKGQQ